MPGPEDSKKPSDEAINPPDPANFYGQKRDVAPVSRRPDGTRPDETRVDVVLVKPEDAAHVVNVTNAFNDLIKLILRINVDDIRSQMAEAEKRAESKKIRRKIRRAVSRVVPLAVAVAGISCAAGATVVAAVAATSISEDMGDIFEYFTLPKVSIANNTTLEGATLKFVCKKFVDASIKPIDVLDYYPTTQLLATPFNVSFNKVAGTEVFPLSVAKSGWGTTINFTNDQLLAGIPDKLSAVSIHVRDDRSAYYLPTGSFIPDPQKVASYVFTTGSVNAEGETVNYYLTASDGNLVCDKKQRGQLSGGPNKIKATLKSQLD